MTSNLSLEPDAAHAGYVHVNPETMLAHGLDRQSAKQAIQQEIRILQDYLNGAVYSISLELDGETIDSISGVYANSTNDPALGIWQTQQFPSTELLDEILPFPHRPRIRAPTPGRQHLDLPQRLNIDLNTTPGKTRQTPIPPQDTAQ